MDITGFVVYFHNLLWLTVGCVYYFKKKSRYAFYFLTIGISSVLSSFAEFALDINVNNTIYLLTSVVEFIFLCKAFNRNFRRFIPLLAIVSLCHILNFYGYKNYELETYWFLIINIAILYIIEREIRVSKGVYPFLFILSLYYVVDSIGRLFIIFQYYDLFQYIAYTSDIFAVYYLLTNPEKKVDKSIDK
jgi:hypothetical protein